MADAFRGLTIRIGADTRPLNSALNSVTASARNVQTEINRLTRALNFDGTSVDAVNSRLNLMNDKLAHSARSAKLVEEALKQQGAPIRAADGAMKNFYADVQRARAGVTNTNTQLQGMYDSLARFRAGEVIEKELKECTARAEQLDAEMKAATDPAVTARLAEELRDVKARMKELGTEAGKTEVFRQQLRIIKQMKGEYGELATIAKRMKEAGEEVPLGVQAESAIGVYKRFEATLKRVHEKHEKFTHDESMAKAAQGVANAQNEWAALDAEMRNSIATMARFREEQAKMAATEGVARARRELALYDTAADRSAEHTRKMVAAYNEFPTSMTLAKAKLSALSTEYSTAAAHAEKLQAAMSELRAAGVDKAAASTEELYANAARAEKAWSDVKVEITQTTAKLELLEDTMEEAKAFAKSGAQGPIADLEKLQGEIDETRAALVKLADEEERVEADFRAANMAVGYRDLEAELDEVYAKMRRIQNMGSNANLANQITGVARTAGYGLYSTLTPAIMMMGRYAAQAADEVDSAYRDMRKTVNGTEEQFESLRKAALEFSRTHVTSADQILEIESIGGQLGIAADSLEAFATTVSNLDIATNMDTEDIALDLAKLSNIMHFNQEQYDSFADSLVRLGNNEPALESDIMTISTRFAGMAANVGMATQDMLALATAATATGQKSEAAGGSMQRTISRIETAVASGGDELEAYARISGMTASEFAATWGDKSNHGPARAIQSFVEGLNSIKQAGGSVDSTLMELGITGVRDKQLLAGLTNTTTVLAESLQMADDAWNGMATVMADGTIENAGDAAREAGRKAEGFSGQLQILKNAAQELGVTMLDSAVPMLKGLTDMFRGFTETVTNMPDWAKDWTVKFAVAAAAAGPMLVAIGAVGNGISSLRNMTEGIKSWWVMKGAKSEIALIAGHLDSLTGKMGETQRRIADIDRQLNSNLPLTDLRRRQLESERKGLVQYDEQLKKSEKRARAFGAGMGMLGTAIKGAGIALAISAIIDVTAKLVQGFMEYQKKAENFKRATEGLADEIGSAVPDIGKAADSVGEYGKSASGSAKSIDELAESTLEMAKAVRERTDAAEDDIARLNNAKQIIDEYGSITDKTTGDIGRYKAAINTVNELCGTQYQVTDALTGALRDENGAVEDVVGTLDKLIEKQKKHIQIEAAGENLRDMYKQRADAIDAVMEAQSKLAEYERSHPEVNYDTPALQEYADALGSSSAQQSALNNDLEKAQTTLSSLDTQIANAEAHYGALSTAQEGVAKSADIAALSSDNLSSAFKRFDNVSLDQFATTIKNAHADYDSFAAAVSNPENAYKMAEAFSQDQTAAHMVEVLTQMGVKFVEVSDDAAAAGGAMAGALEEVDEETQQLYDSVSLLADSNAAFRGLVEETGMSVDDFSRTFIECGYSIDDLSSKIDDLAKTASDGFNQIAEESEFGLEAYMENLEHNRELVERWGDNVRAAYERAGDESTRAWIKSVADAGPQYAALVEEIANSSDDEFGRAAEAWSAAFEEGSNSAVASMGYDIDKMRSMADEANNMNINPKVNVDTGQLELTNDEMDDLRSKMDKPLTLVSDFMSLVLAKAASDNLTESVEKIPGFKDVNVNETGDALGRLNDIEKYMNDLDGKAADVVVRMTEVHDSVGGNARGAIVNGAGRIPLNAAGALNGIVTSAKLTNIGWVGEAGAEAVMHMRNAGGAVVPLSNRRYVRPFARAVASEMGGRGGRTVNVTVNLDYKAGDDAAKLARGVARRIEAYMDLGA